MKKKLTIIIPVYNNRSVQNAIESVKKIKSNEVELIIVDGKSTDGTLDVISGYKEIIDIFISETDSNVHEAINKGIDVSNGTWIFVLAADDRLICNPLQIIEKYGDKNYDLLCGNIIMTYGDGKYLMNKSNADLSRLKYICSLRHPATFFRKNLYDKFGKYDESLKCAGDRDIFLRLYTNNVCFGIIPEFVTLFYLGGISAKNPIKYAYKEDIIISDRYHVNKIKTRVLFVKRCMGVYIGKILYVLRLKHARHYLSKEDIYKNLEKINPTIINFEL